MSLTLQLPQKFFTDVASLVAEDSQLHGTTVGLSENTANAWAALKKIAAGVICDDAELKDALAVIRNERKDDRRLIALYQEYAHIIDAIVPKRQGWGRWVLGE